LAAGRRVGVGRLVERAAVSPAPLVEITGGEPLLQESFRALAAGLRDGTNKRVLVETNGSMDISAVPAGVVAVVDVKCPGSGEGGSFDPGNLGRLRRYDELKFVISDRRDFEWAAAFVRRNGLPGACAAVLFSPAAGRLDPARLARWIVRGGVAARLQVPLHRVLGLK
jgi:7-carboxy-7-deazaguanine synthase